MQGSEFLRFCFPLVLIAVVLIGYDTGLLCAALILSYGVVPWPVESVIVGGGFIFEGSTVFEGLRLIVGHILQGARMPHLVISVILG